MYTYIYIVASYSIQLVLFIDDVVILASYVASTYVYFVGNLSEHIKT